MQFMSTTQPSAIDHQRRHLRRAIAAWLASAALLLAALAPSPAPAAVDPDVEILLVGNSFTKGIKNMLRDLILSSGRTAYVTDRAGNGWRLDMHAANNGTINKINSNDWDYVFLQE